MPPEYELVAKRWRTLIKKSVTFIFLFIWTLVLWIVAVYKWQNDGGAFFTFFTNWNWTLQIIFFTIEFGAYASGIQTLKIFNQTFIFWIVSGTTWLVFWLVFFMIHDNADFFLELSTIDGGPYQLWVVLNGHALFHVLISIALLIYIILQKDYIDDSCTPFLSWKQRHKSDERNPDDISSMALFYHWRLKSIFYILYVTFAGAVLLLIYVCSFNIYAIYGLTTSYWALIFTALAVIFIFNGLYVFMNMITLTEPKTRLYKRYGKLKTIFWYN